MREGALIKAVRKWILIGVVRGSIDWLLVMTKGCVG